MTGGSESRHATWQRRPWTIVQDTESGVNSVSLDVSDFSLTALGSMHSARWRCVATMVLANSVSGHGGRMRKTGMNGIEPAIGCSMNRKPGAARCIQPDLNIAAAAPACGVHAPDCSASKPDDDNWAARP